MFKRIYEVREITSYLKNLLEGDTHLANVWVKGEVSNLKQSPSGHIYFTLKDRCSCLPCVCFRSRHKLLNFIPQDGVTVVARGYISLFEKCGTCQLYVEELQPSGTGELYIAFEKLKNKLDEEGLFDEKHKRKIPFLPRRIGIVTSPTGAAIRDILSVISRRFPNTELVLVPVQVQGEDASEEIAEGINLLNCYGKVDVIIIARGGGSLEEIWPFNTETVARSIFNSKIPVISAVGHETDHTIADFVADFRAATPSAAAEIAVPRKEELVKLIQGLSERLNAAVKLCVSSKREKLDAVAARRVFTKPEGSLNSVKQQVDALYAQLQRSVQRYLKERFWEVRTAAGKMHALSPLAVLSRGYAVCRFEKNRKIIRNYQEVSPGTLVEVVLNKGLLNCRVESRRRSIFSGRQQGEGTDKI